MLRKKRTTGVIGRLGPAKDEDYDFEGGSPITQTGRAMPVPGFVGGVHEAHQKYGKLPRDNLFAPAIRHAENGFLVNPKFLDAAKRKGVRHPEGRKIWGRNGQMLRPDQPLVQTEAAGVLKAIADNGPAAFYEGEFAQHYVKRAQEDGGKITLNDLKSWKNLVKHEPSEPRGNYRGYRVMGGDLIIYALHLNEALNLKASRNAATSPDSVYKQIRIMEEVFLSSKDLTTDGSWIRSTLVSVPISS